MKQIAWMMMVFLVGTVVFAQQSAPGQSTQPVASYDEGNAPEALDVIFSNLGPSRDDLYNSDAQALPVAGKDASNDTEQWLAIRFTPTADVQASVLAAAVSWVSGDRLVRIGLYDNNDILNTVGDPLPGGEGSTTDIPDFGFGACCQLAKVTLPEPITLNQGVSYWLVVSPDDTSGSTFAGRWYLSNLALSGTFFPPLPWRNLPGQWPAAEVRGTILQTAEPNQAAKVTEPPSSAADATAAHVTIFSNLDRIGPILYLYGLGSVVTGSEAPSGQEVQQALPFTPRKDLHAKVLAAAIGHVSGTNKIQLGIYSDSGGTVGAPLPGGQGSTTDIPESGVCCELAKVRLPGAGIALQAGVQYWLVASPDEEQAPDFEGLWQDSDLALRAYQQPEFFIGWTDVSGGWLAAEIRGTNP